MAGRNPEFFERYEHGNTAQLTASSFEVSRRVAP